jgi:hypothetical protein
MFLEFGRATSDQLNRLNANARNGAMQHANGHPSFEFLPRRLGSKYG